MYTIETFLELPIAHCLYRGAYSGLCCGNVYRDKGQCDGKDDRYDLGDKVFPILHGHTYKVTIKLASEELDKNGMVVDFKLMKKILREYFDRYDHSMVLTPDNPLTKFYLESNSKESNKKLIVWDENPTAEYMAKFWHDEILKLFKKEKFNVKKVFVTVEETSHNSATFTN